MVTGPLRLSIGFLCAGCGSLLAQPRPATAGLGRPRVVPPQSLTAVSTVPTQIVLNWPAVAGADGYRVTRARIGEAEAILFEGQIRDFARDPGMCAEGMPCWFPNNRVSLASVYSYRVSAIFPGPVYSRPGPATAVRSAPFRAPANLTHAVVASVRQPGQLQVTVSWLPVVGAERYLVVPTTADLAPTIVTTTSVRFEPLAPNSRHGLCVSAIYPLNIRNDSVKSCITLVL